jgi:histidyl-tRNA synthetase
MSSQYRAPKGVPEYTPPLSGQFLAVRELLSTPPQMAGYGYIELPVFEDTGLFERGVGESTDVVSKEMYTFTDRGDRSISLRPEGTAGVMRSVIEHNMHRGGLPVKLWYAGPFFRAERPQLGRYRQLQQVGVEAIGSDDPALDAEVISLADRAFIGVGLRDYVLHLNSLGCSRCRPAYSRELREFLSGCDLDEATQHRAHINPLRVLDDKRPEIQQQVASAPLPVDHLCAECVEHYDATRRYLQDLGVSWQESPRLVRGLDYYTRTAFEFTHEGLGAQSGIGGGGRYDGLMASLGGPELSGIGFGLGVDRTLLAAQSEGVEFTDSMRVACFVIPVGEAARHRAVSLLGRLRDAGVASDMAFDSRALKGSMKAADRSGARFALIIGDEEITTDSVMVRDLTSGDQEQVGDGEIVNQMKQRHSEWRGYR